MNSILKCKLRGQIDVDGNDQSILPMSDDQSLNNLLVKSETKVQNINENAINQTTINKADKESNKSNFLNPNNEKIIFVRNLPIDSWDEKVIKNLFCEFGEIEEVIK